MTTCLVNSGEFLAYAKTEELKSQWIDAINHAKYAYYSTEVCALDAREFWNVALLGML